MAIKTYYIKIGAIKYAWKANDSKYKNIASTLGILEASSSEKDLVFGANRPKPPRIRLNFTGTDDSSELVFCSPDKVSAALKGDLNGKTSNGKKIEGAKVPG